MKTTRMTCILLMIPEVPYTGVYSKGSMLC